MNDADDEIILNFYERLASRMNEWELTDPSHPATGKELMSGLTTQEKKDTLSTIASNDIEDLVVENVRQMAIGATAGQTPHPGSTVARIKERIMNSNK